MKNIWKWIIGVVIVLVVLAAVGFVASGFFVSRMARVERFESFHPPISENFERGDRRAPGFDYDHFRSPMGGFDRRIPLHGFFMPMPFMLFGGFLRLIFPLAVLGAVGYFAYKKGKKDGAAEALSTPVDAVVDSEPEKEKPKKK